jgi:hypothetical protein
MTLNEKQTTKATDVGFVIEVYNTSQEDLPQPYFVKSLLATSKGALRIGDVSDIPVPITLESIFLLKEMDIPISENSKEIDLVPYVDVPATINMMVLKPSLFISFCLDPVIISYKNQQGQTDFSELQTAQEYFILKVLIDGIEYYISASTLKEKEVYFHLIETSNKEAQPYRFDVYKFDISTMPDYIYRNSHSIPVKYSNEKKHKFLTKGNWTVISLQGGSAVRNVESLQAYDRSSTATASI